VRNIISHPELVEGSVQLQFPFMNLGKTTLMTICLVAMYASTRAEDDKQVQDALWLADHAKLEHKVNTWRLGNVDMKRVPFDQVVDFLRHRTQAIDPEHRGINFVAQSTPDLHAMIFTVKLTDPTVADVLNQLPMVGYTIGDFSIDLEDSWGDRMFSYTLHVPDNALAINPSMLIDGQKQTYDAKSLLESKGVRFPPGTSATYELPTKSLTMIMTSREDFVFIKELLVYGFKNVPAKTHANSQ